MKRFLVVVAAILLGSILVAFLYFSPSLIRKNPQPPETSIDFFSCQQDSDCIKVDADVCGCLAGGRATSINKKYLTQWNENLEVLCAMVISDDPTCLGEPEPRCLEGKCQLTRDGNPVHPRSSIEGGFCTLQDPSCPNLYYCLLGEGSIGHCLKGDIDSQEDPKLGLAGFSSGDLVINKTKIHLRLLAPDRQKVTLSSFPCLDEKEITAVRGNFRIMAFDSTMKKLIDSLEIGEKEFVMEPANTEQTGLFSKLVVLSVNPRYEAFTLAFSREFCSDTEIFFYSFNDKQQKVMNIPFLRKDGGKRISIYIPKGLSIPQIDAQGDVISSTYNSKSGGRDNVRYKFNLEKFAYEEIGAYSRGS